MRNRRLDHVAAIVALLPTGLDWFGQAAMPPPVRRGCSGSGGILQKECRES
jgi:hypothetical protein